MGTTIAIFLIYLPSRAEIYDRLTFDIDYPSYADNIKTIIEARGLEDPYILEMGCGTGNLTKELASYGYEILAFDNSMEMLNMAFPKLVDKDRVNLIYADIKHFDFNSNYDVIISLLDVINYFTDEKELKKMFENVYRGLRPGGVFIFDLNSYNKLKVLLADNTYVYEYENIFYTWENKMEGDLIHFYLNFFVRNKDNKYERIRESQVERYYSIEYIESLLTEVGFEKIEYIDEDSKGEVTDKTQRILFSAIK